MKKSPVIVGMAAMALLALSFVLVTNQGSFTGALGGTGTTRERVKRYVDTNQNGQTEVSEIRAALLRVIRGVPSGGSDYDVNADGITDARDIRAMVQALRGILAPRCGDGEVDVGEQCDDGDTDNTDACTNECKNAVCGDGFVGPNEQCDDHGTVAGDGCSATCTNEPRHLACVDYACTSVLGSGPNSCGQQADCAPTYGMSVDIPDTPPQLLSPSRPSTFDVVVTTDTPQTNMRVDIDFRSLLSNMYEVWEPDPRCEELNLGSGTKYVSCPLASVTPSSPARFTFTMQPMYFPNCTNITPSASFDVTVSYNRAYGQNEPYPYTHHVSLPLQCLTTSSLLNMRPTEQSPVVELSSCTNAKIGNGNDDFYFASAWIDRAGAGDVFASLTGNVSAHFTYDPQRAALTYQLFSVGGRNFMRDAVWDADRNVAYLFVQRFQTVNNSAIGEEIDVYDPVTNTITASAPLDTAGGYYGLSGTPLRKGILKDGKAYFFPVYFFNTQPMNYVYVYDPDTNVVTEVTHTADPVGSPLDLSPYPAAAADVYKPSWKKCFLNSANVPRSK